MVATRDIAAVAAQALKARDWKGVVVRELLGPRDLSHSEATRIIGERIGKPDLQYVQFSYADEVKALMQAGMSESFANLYVEMTRAFNERKITPRRTPRTRHRHDSRTSRANSPMLTSRRRKRAKSLPQRRFGSATQRWAFKTMIRSQMQVWIPCT
jgi:hypothetical protein